MALTSEYFESTGLTICQPTKGHRYGRESLALADFCGVRKGDKVVEFGSGVGVIALQVAAGGKPSEVVAVEIQKELHKIARANVEKNNLADVVKCVNDDYRRFARLFSSSFDLVLSNPPFYAAGHGRLSVDFQRAIARHELKGSLDDLLASSKRTLRPKGRLAIVFPIGRKQELTDSAFQIGFEMIRCKGDSDSVVLVEFELR